MAEFIRDPALTIAEFRLQDCLDLVGNPAPGGADVHPVTVIADGPRAPYLHPLMRPPVRYLDDSRSRLAWRRLWAAVNEWAPDVVLANPCARPGGAPPFIALSQSPVVYYCDEPRRVDYEAAARASTKPTTRMIYAHMRRSQRSADRASVAAAATLVTNSTFTKARILNAYERSSNVVAPGIDDLFNASHADASRHVLSVGALVRSKGHDLAIRALAESQLGLPMVLVTPRDNQTEIARLRAIAGQVGVALDVRVAISDEDLALLYGQSLATVYLARDEPLGLVSLESQACGTPVVVADEGGLTSTVEQAVTGFRVARQSAAAADALRMVASHRTEMGRAAAARYIPRNADSAEAMRRILDTAAVTA